jgi:hypothetical protein
MKALLRLFVVLIPVFAHARVISYAPYTDRSSIPAVQSRLNRHFVLIESGPAGQQIPNPSPLQGAQVVLYDTLDEREPRVVFPTDGKYAAITAAAVRENAAGTPVIFVQTVSGASYTTRVSPDAGATWLTVAGVSAGSPMNFLTSDTGGPFARARGSQVRIGDEAYPFVMLAGGTLYAISVDGSSRALMTGTGSVVGSDREGSRFLARVGSELRIVGREGSTAVGAFAENGEGWITPSGDVYIEERSRVPADQPRMTLFLFRRGAKEAVLAVDAPGNAGLLAVPTFDYSGAWIIERYRSRPTSLYLHTSSAGLAKQWEDVTGPEVEALHTGSSGKTLLIQVHRPKPQFDQRVFVDPALAVWRLGQPAPRVYDELYLNEQVTKGFVHLDVERVESGDPFVFDSGVLFAGGGGGNVSAGGGGGDIVQEWGVVRGSLKQRLVLPSVGRTPGAFGSSWVSDAIVYNPLAVAQRVTVQYVPTGSATTVAEVRTLTMGPREIRLLEDVSKSMFNIEQGIGALLFDADDSINVVGRTYSQSSTGTYGFGMMAVDAFAAAASPRFPVTFAGAFLGPDYRTNLVLTDTSGRGIDAALSASGVYGPMGLASVMFQVGPSGQQQFNGIGASLGLQFYEAGALTVKPARGTAVASLFVVDNRTNDATYFPPDMTAPFGRAIAAIGHLDGANNSRFRSDLYIHNTGAAARTVNLTATPWEAPLSAAHLAVTLLPNESRIFRDVLNTVFNKTGIARLRYQAFGDMNGIRVTSRTYNVDDKGGTYGFLMPPFNNFQIAASGETLEILGAVADSRYRTNVGLVDTNMFSNGQTLDVRIDVIDNSGKQVDSFMTTVASSGGRQLNDVFRSRDLNVTGPVLIRVTPRGGLIGAYATMTDNRTNDSIYLAANLAAQE